MYMITLTELKNKKQKNKIKLIILLIWIAVHTDCACVKMWIQVCMYSMYVCMYSPTQMAGTSQVGEPKEGMFWT